MLPEFPDDHVVAICGVLADHGVDFLIIGGVAARLHETGHATVDIDICPSRAKANLARLAEALQALGAKLRAEGEPDGVAFEPHADLLERVSTLTLITRFGPLDLCFAPAGFDRGYDELVGGAVVVVVAGASLPVASLDDIITSKRVAGRPKDIVALPALEARRNRPPR